MKKGFFFILDTVLAFLIIVIGVTLILSANISTKTVFQASASATEFLTILSSTTPADLTGVQYLNELRLRNVLNDTHLSKPVLQVITEYYLDGEVEIATNISREVAGLYIPEQYNVELFLNETMLYNRTVHNVKKSNSPALISKRTLLIASQEDLLIGPYVAQVIIW